MSAVFLERAGEGKFAEAMADHVFGDENGVKDFSVVDAKREPDEIGSDHRTPRPGFDRGFGFGIFGLLDFFQEVTIDKRTFFN